MVNSSRTHSKLHACALITGSSVGAVAAAAWPHQAFSTLNSLFPAGNDWYFLSNPLSNSYPDGSTNDLQLAATLAAHSTYITQVSAIGWVTSTRNKVWSFSVAVYGAQQSTECDGDGHAPYCAADAGNGVLANGNKLYNNLTWYQPYTPADALAFTAHMRQRATPQVFDSSVILQLDNEPDIWDSTHRDCHPAPLTYDELWNYTLAYSSALKAAYPGVRVAGPIWCCWCAYFWSAKDGCSNGADMAAHDDMSELAHAHTLANSQQHCSQSSHINATAAICPIFRYITPWLLSKLNTYYLEHGVQLLDALDIHYYPNVKSDESTQANQQQFTDQVRSFWDPTYPDPGWIGSSGCGTGCNGPYVNLIPRFQQWIAQYAPNLTLPLAISEFAFHNSDAEYSPTLANAEVLAVMGVHGVLYSSRWTSPTVGSVAEGAYKMYLNYDGAGGKVTGDSVPTSSSTTNALNAYSVYNASSQTMFVLLFNLAFTADNAVSVNINHASVAGSAWTVTASAWQMSAASTSWTAQSSTNFTAAASNGLNLAGYAVPARSATLLVLPGVVQTTSSPSSASSSSSSSSPSSSSSTSSLSVQTTSSSSAASAAATSASHSSSPTPSPSSSAASATVSSTALTSAASSVSAPTSAPTAASSSGPVASSAPSTSSSPSASSAASSASASSGSAAPSSSPAVALSAPSSTGVQTQTTTSGAARSFTTGAWLMLLAVLPVILAY